MAVVVGQLGFGDVLRDETEVRLLSSYLEMSR
jgi:hypothetical protein